MSNYQQSSFKEKTAEGEDGGSGSGHGYDVHQQHESVLQEKMCFDETQPFTTSSPVKMHWQNVTYTILPEEYSVIEDNDTGNQWNPDEAFSESMQLDESINTLYSSASSSSSSSSSNSISYLLAKARQMIAKYPNEVELDDMVAENYLNYIAEVLQQQSPPSPQLLQLQSPGLSSSSSEEQEEEEEQAVAAAVNDTAAASNDDSVILLESTGVQTSFSYEEPEDNNETSEEEGEEEEEEEETETEETEETETETEIMEQ